MKEIVPFKIVLAKFTEDHTFINKKTFLDLSEDQCKDYRRVCNKITKYTLQQNPHIKTPLNLFKKDLINYTTLRAFLRLNKNHFLEAIDQIENLSSADFEKWVTEKNKIASLEGPDLKIYQMQKLLNELKDLL